MIDMNAFRQFGQARASLGQSVRRPQIDAERQVRRAKVGLTGDHPGEHEDAAAPLATQPARSVS